MCGGAAEGAGKRWGSSRKSKLGLLEPTIGNRRPDLQYSMSAGRRPTHLSLLVHPSIHEAVGGAFGRRTRYRLTGPISIAVVDNRRRVLDQVGLKIADQYGRSLELLAGVSKPTVLLQLVEHILHGSRRLSDVAAPEKMPKSRHINRDIPKVDVQIADMPDSFPCLFDVPEPHRQMEPVKNMRHGLPCCTEHDALQPDISVAENSDVAARQPSLRPHRGTNHIVLAVATCGAAAN